MILFHNGTPVISAAQVTVKTIEIRRSRVPYMVFVTYLHMRGARVYELMLLMHAKS